MRCVNVCVCSIVFVSVCVYVSLLLWLFKLNELDANRLIHTK
jgi:hypothetical protein